MPDHPKKELLHVVKHRSH